MQMETFYNITVPISQNELKDIEASINQNSVVQVVAEVKEDGLHINLQDILFDSDKYDLRSESIPILQDLISRLNQFPEYEIEIRGHTDNVGSQNYNQKLSEERALSVYQFLKTQGLKHHKIYYQGIGETQPAYPNSNEINRQKNRRVEIILKQNGY